MKNCPLPPWQVEVVWLLLRYPAMASVVPLHPQFANGAHLPFEIIQIVLSQFSE
jgi:hypothetical protein